MVKHCMCVCGGGGGGGVWVCMCLCECVCVCVFACVLCCYYCKGLKLMTILRTIKQSIASSILIIYMAEHQK